MPISIIAIRLEGKVKVYTIYRIYIESRRSIMLVPVADALVKSRTIFNFASRKLVFEPTITKFNYLHLKQFINKFLGCKHITRKRLGLYSVPYY